MKIALNPYKLIGIVLLILAGVFLAGTFTSKYGSVANVTRRDFKILFGSSISAPATLNNSYTGGGSVSSTDNNVAGLSKYVFSVAYTPKSYGSYMYMNIERALDPSCTTYYPFVYLNPGSTSTTIYNAGASSTVGMPYVLGDATSASGTTQYASFDLQGPAECIKASAQEYTTSTYGTIYSDVLITNQN